MAKKRAIIGFKGIALAPVTQNDILGYKSEAAFSLPYAGGMSRTPKESTFEPYYDDALYAQFRELMGEDVEIRVAEAELALLAKLGLGEYDETTETFEGDFSVEGQYFALRCVTDTIDKLPFYFNYRLFQLNGIRFDNFATKGNNVAICEVIITGVFLRPTVGGLKPWAVMQLKEDKSNQDACNAFLSATETFPKTEEP